MKANVDISEENAALKSYRLKYSETEIHVTEFCLAVHSSERKTKMK
jgi:hypothetical protein